jgi:hypothetical protein
MTGNKQVVHWTSGTWCKCSEIAGFPQGSPQQPTMWLWSWKEDLQRAWNRDRRAVWDQVGLSHCRHDDLVTVRDEENLPWVKSVTSEIQDQSGFVEAHYEYSWHLDLISDGSSSVKRLNNFQDYPSPEHLANYLLDLSHNVKVFDDILILFRYICI